MDEDGLDDDNAGGGGGGGGVGGGGGADCGFYFPLNSLCRGARGRPPPPEVGRKSVCWCADSSYIVRMTEMKEHGSTALSVLCSLGLCVCLLVFLVSIASDS